jgi:hypothetical protein
MNGVYDEPSQAPAQTKKRPDHPSDDPASPPENSLKLRAIEDVRTNLAHSREATAP